MRTYKVKIVHVFYQTVEAETREEALERGYEQHLEDGGGDFDYSEATISR